MLLSQQRTEEEKQALTEGAVLWKDVAITVTNFEKRLRQDMAGAGASLSDSTHDWDNETPASTPTERMKELLRHMDAVLESLQAKLDFGEEKSWTLLISAIGAEIDALRRGRAILQNVWLKLCQSLKKLIRVMMMRGFRPCGRDYWIYLRPRRRRIVVMRSGNRLRVLRRLGGV
jgi:hypothetical protein